MRFAVPSAGFKKEIASELRLSPVCDSQHRHEPGLSNLAVKRRYRVHETLPVRQKMMA
jgi:hypothetical protein